VPLLVGAVVKPIGGVSDGLSTVMNGISNEVSNNKSAICQIRPCRTFTRSTVSDFCFFLLWFLTYLCCYLLLLSGAISFFPSCNCCPLFLCMLRLRKRFFVPSHAKWVEVQIHL
jgi:hypothetical protein